MFVVVSPPGLRRRPKSTPRVCAHRASDGLATESVDCSSLALQGVDDIEGGDGLTTSVFGVGDGVPYDGFKEGLENSTCLFVDKSRDSFKGGLPS